MPFKRKGKIIYSKSGGRWHVKQRCKSARNAKIAVSILHRVTGH